MKKIFIFINIVLALCSIWMLTMFILNCISADLLLDAYSTYPKGAEGIQDILNSITQSIIFLVIDFILLLCLCFIIFLLNYHFNGTPLREKIATRLLEGKERRAQYRAEKAAADKQAAIEDKQKRLEQLQAELNALKKE